MKTLAIANQKGGVGKTTTAVNLAVYLADQYQKEILIVDLDSQGHVCTSLGLAKNAGLYGSLVEEIELNELVVEARPNLDVLPNDHSNEAVKNFVMSKSFREYMLHRWLQVNASHYDLVILDCPPGTDVLHILALVAADYLIIPSIMDHLSLDGIKGILTTVAGLNEFPGVDAPRVLGVLPTLYDRVSNETMRNLQNIITGMSGYSVLPPIPRDTKLREASAYGQAIFEYAPSCAGSIGQLVEGTSATNSAGRVGGYLHLGEILGGALWQ